jgi:hypothetical protein
MQRVYQTNFSDHGIAMCEQCNKSGFLDELYTVTITNLFQTFREDMNDTELHHLRDKLSAIDFIINTIRTNSYANAS